MFTRRDASTSDQSVRDESANISAGPGAAPATQSAESLIAQEDTFEGTLKTTTGVRVLGTVRGSIESQRSVRIDSGATVEADITAEEVVIAGTFRGNLTCRNRVEIAATGHVTGKVDTAKLHLHEGGFFDGELRMQRPGETSRAPESDEARPRRSRYVDLASDSSKTTPPAAENASEVGKTPEASS